MASTYEPIATNTLGSAAASVTFSSIPATYTDLVLVFNGTSATTQAIEMRLNSDTSTNYSATRLYGDGSSAASDRSSTSDVMLVGNTYSTVNTVIIQIMNYANATTYKSVLCRANNAGAQVSARVGLWRKSPEAVTTIFLRPGGSANWDSGSTFTLFGIKAA